MATALRDAAVPVTDEAIRPIVEKVPGGERLDAADIVALFTPVRSRQDYSLIEEAA